MDLIENLTKDLKIVFEKYQVKVYCQDMYIGIDEECAVKICPQFGDSEDTPLIDFSEIFTNSLGIKVKVSLY